MRCHSDDPARLVPLLAMSIATVFPVTMEVDYVRVYSGDL